MARGPIVTPAVHTDFGRNFLVAPDAFPERAEGSPFGAERLVLRIADHDLVVDGLGTLQAEAMRAMWREFTRAEAAPDATSIAVYRVEASRFRERELRGWSYELDFDHGVNETHIAGLDLMARLDGPPALAGALWTSAEAPEVFRGAFENFVRVLLAHAMLSRGGALLHCASVIEEGAAKLFLGPSGAGKSTVARLALATGREVASDDLNPVVPRKTDFHACGSPFLGDVGSRRSGSFPLRAIYRLVQGEADALRPMGRGETVASLVACAPFVNRSPHLEERLWANLERLAERVPGHVLTFRREGTFWPLLKD